MVKLRLPLALAFYLLCQIEPAQLGLVFFLACQIERFADAGEFFRIGIIELRISQCSFALDDQRVQLFHARGQLFIIAPVFVTELG